MDPAVQAFKDKKAEKAAVKAEVLAALGRAKLAEAKGQDASADWAIVEREGFRSGTEGRLHNELQQMADAFVEAHPELFANVEHLVNPEGHHRLVRMISIFRQEGLEEEALRLEMFERARFERQEIGQAIRAKVRMAGGRG